MIIYHFSLFQYFSCFRHYLQPFFILNHLFQQSNHLLLNCLLQILYQWKTIQFFLDYLMLKMYHQLQITSFNQVYYQNHLNLVTNHQSVMFDYHFVIVHRLKAYFLQVLLISLMQLQEGNQDQNHYLLNYLHLELLLCYLLQNPSVFFHLLVSDFHFFNFQPYFIIYQLHFIILNLLSQFLPQNSNEDFLEKKHAKMHVIVLYENLLSSKHEFLLILKVQC